MNTEKFPFQKVFKHEGRSFSATTAAEKWLKDRGFSVGSMCCSDPRAIVRTPNGQEWVQKWHNLSVETKRSMAGMVLTKDSRDGDILVCLTADPDSL